MAKRSLPSASRTRTCLVRAPGHDVCDSSTASAPPGSATFDVATKPGPGSCAPVAASMWMTVLGVRTSTASSSRLTRGRSVSTAVSPV